MKLLFSINTLLILSLFRQALSRPQLIHGNEEESLSESKPNHLDYVDSQSNNNFNDNTFEGTSDETENSDSYVAIMSLQYYGIWNTMESSNDQQFEFLTENAGYAEFTAKDVGSDNLDDSITFWFYDGQYVDQRAVSIQFVYDNDTDFNPANATFQNNSISFEVNYLYNKETQQQKTCNGSYQLSFIDSTTGDPYQESLQNYENAIAQFWLTSAECDIAIFASVAVDNSTDETRAIAYAIMVTLICVGHIYACMQMVRQITTNQSEGTRYSLLTLGLFTGWDVFLCLFHFYGALTTEVFFHYFITPAFWYFILASILEVRLLLVIWRAKYYHSFQTADQLRRGIWCFYSQFYGFLISFILICYFFLPEIWLFYLTSLFFVPQIVHNALRGQRYKFDKSYVLLLGALRIIIPVTLFLMALTFKLYAKGYNESIFRLTPDSTFVLCYPGIVLSQVLFLYLQSKIGSRFFVPASLLPPKHNYFIKIPTNIPIEEMDLCAICMESLGQEVGALATEPLILKQKNIKAMQTPCKHTYHEKCLKEWMEIKLECPFCRTPLPALE